MAHVQVFSARSLAQRWGCSAKTILAMVQRGELKSFRVGSLVRVSLAEVEKFETCATELQNIEEAGSVLSITKTAHADELRLRRLTNLPRPQKPVASLVPLKGSNQNEA